MHKLRHLRVDARQVAELPGGLDDVDHLWADLLSVCGWKFIFPKKVGLVPNIAVALIGCGVEAVDRVTNVACECGHPLLKVLDAILL